MTVKLSIISKSCITFTTDIKNVRHLQQHKHGSAYATASLLQLLHSPDLLPVDSLLELVSLQTADILNICCKCHTTFAVNAELYCHIKINLVLCLFT